MPSLRPDDLFGWPQLDTELGDHEQLKKSMLDSGKSFKSTDAPLPDFISKALKDKKLSSFRKAGTISKQKSSASTAWFLHHASSDFASAAKCWAGFLNQKRPNALLFLLYGLFFCEVQSVTH